ncbi:MAG TPA: beta-ketoacyl-[acyl-carrier-protein] synthase family protein [Micromonosporaceae bacterium]|nr:beta-ketoacyl-[acyl-carrier-protein] synthase family protein [Micromonosporaceae bacterium]
MTGPGTGGRRVAITGLGVKSPAGLTLTETMAALHEAVGRAGPVPALADEALPVRFAGTVPQFDPAPYFTVREGRQLDRTAQLALAAAMDAVADSFPEAGPLEHGVGADRVGVAVGTGVGGAASIESGVREFTDRPGSLPAFTVPRIMANSPAGRVAIRLGAHGPALTYSTACASGATAIGEAARKIQYGELDLAVAGGVDAPISPMIVAAFARMGALSCRNDSPQEASRPFDSERDGFVMSEGAAFLILERLDLALARGARIYGELAGYGSTSDAHHIVIPQPGGEGAARCIRAALADARLSPGDIGHVNAHGTSTVRNDRAEAEALRTCFGPDTPPVTAPKGVVGHMVGAAGAFEAAVALVSAREGRVPPVANFVKPDLDEQVNVVAGEPLHIATAPVLSNSFGFGGHNVSLVLVPYT